MKKINLITNSGEINLREVILLLLRNKFLILSISILFSILGYIYFINQPTQVKVKIKLLDPPQNLFGIDRDAKENYKILINDFRLNILSSDNIESFLIQSKDFDDFKAFLKSRDINIKSYFTNSLIEDKTLNVVIPNHYILHCTKELNAEFFLTSYIDYLWSELIQKQKKNIENNINYEILLHNLALNGALKANIDKPLRKDDFEFNSLDLIFQGTLVLKEKIKFLEIKKLEINKISPNFEQVLESPFYIKSSNNTFFYYAISGFIVGFFLSLGAIFFKNFLKEK